jgi:hypothetical protein
MGRLFRQVAQLKRREKHHSLPRQHAALSPAETIPQEMPNLLAPSAIREIPKDIQVEGSQKLFGLWGTGLMKQSADPFEKLVKCPLQTVNSRQRTRCRTPGSEIFQGHQRRLPYEGIEIRPNRDPAFTPARSPASLRILQRKEEGLQPLPMGHLREVRWRESKSAGPNNYSLRGRAFPHRTDDLTVRFPQGISLVVLENPPAFATRVLQKSCRCFPEETGAIGHERDLPRRPLFFQNLDNPILIVWNEPVVTEKKDAVTLDCTGQSS